LSGDGILLQHVLHQHGEAIDTFAHVDVPQAATLPRLAVRPPESRSDVPMLRSRPTISLSSFANREREQIVLTNHRKSVREMDAYLAALIAGQKYPVS
jgi:hypothetical protein